MHNEPTIGRRVSYMSDGGFSGSARCWIRGSQPGVHVPLMGVHLPIWRGTFILQPQQINFET